MDTQSPPLTAMSSKLLFFFAIFTCAGMGAIAAETEPVAAPAYRLTIGSPDAFRLKGSEMYVPTPAPVKPPPIPAHLADKPYAVQIDSAARQAALDPALVHALIYVESRYNPAARSPKGAIGLMQLMPDTALRYGVTKAVHAPEANLRAGTRYLSDLMTMFDNRVDLALAAYNAGENAVLRYGLRIPPYRETREYVPAVLARYRDLQGPPPAPAPAAASRVRIEYLPGTRLDPESLGAAQER